jgi:hypothetical protein
VHASRRDATSLVTRRLALDADVATNVAIAWFLDVAQLHRTEAYGAGSLRRFTACGWRFCGAQALDRLGLGDRPQDNAGRVRRFAGCMAWKRSGVRFPLAPLHESPGHGLVAVVGSSLRAGGSPVLDPFLDPFASSLDPNVSSTA